MNEWRRRSRNFGFCISFSKFQDLGIAGIVERDYIRGIDTLEAVRLRGRRWKKLGSVTIP